MFSILIITEDGFMGGLEEEDEKEAGTEGFI